MKDKGGIKILVVEDDPFVLSLLKDFLALIDVNFTPATTGEEVKTLLQNTRFDLAILDYELPDTTGPEIAREISYVPQRSEIPSITVFEAVLLGRKPYIKWDATKNDIEITKNVLKMLDLERFSLRYITEISGGEFQKVVIARALVQQPKVMLLDEPTNNLDLKNQFEVMDIIKKISRIHNIASVVVMHDINLALRFSDGFVLMKEGKIFASGGIEVITPENVESVYGIPVMIEKINGHIFVEPIYQTGFREGYLSVSYG